RKNAGGSTCAAPDGQGLQAPFPAPPAAPPAPPAPPAAGGGVGAHPAPPPRHLAAATRAARAASVRPSGPRQPPAGPPAGRSFAREIAVAGVSKREAESRAAARRPRPRSAESGSAAPDVHLRALAEELTRGLGTRVRIARRGRGGAIEIEFYSDAELDRLVDRLRMAATSAAAML